MGIQELLVHLHPAFAVLVVPLLAAAFVVFLPYLNYGETPSGLWFHSANGRRTALAAAGAALVAVPAGILANEYILSLPKLLPFLPQAVSNGALPMGLLVLLVLGFFGLIRWRFTASRIEAIQAVFTLLVVGLVVLTVTGVFFRGASMRLVWPWAATGGP
jgi:hypothetical protein